MCLGMKFCGGKGIYLSLAWSFCFTVALEAKQHNVGMLVNEQSNKKAFIKKIVRNTRTYEFNESHLILIAPRTYVFTVPDPAAKL